jgi:hypothetical protein
MTAENHSYSISSLAWTHTRLEHGKILFARTEPQSGGGGGGDYDSW